MKLSELLTTIPQQPVVYFKNAPTERQVDIKSKTIVSRRVTRERKSISSDNTSNTDSSFNAIAYNKSGQPTKGLSSAVKKSNTIDVPETFETKRSPFCKTPSEPSMSSRDFDNVSVTKSDESVNRLLGEIKKLKEEMSKTAKPSIPAETKLEISELKKSVKTLNAANKKLETTLKNQEQSLQQACSKQLSAHEHSKNTLEQTKNLLSSAKNEHKEQEKAYKLELKKLQNEQKAYITKIEDRDKELKLLQVSLNKANAEIERLKKVSDAFSIFSQPFILVLIFSQELGSQPVVPMTIKIPMSSRAKSSSKLNAPEHLSESSGRKRSEKRSGRKVGIKTHHKRRESSSCSSSSISTDLSSSSSSDSSLSRSPISRKASTKRKKEESRRHLKRRRDDFSSCSSRSTISRTTERKSKKKRKGRTKEYKSSHKKRGKSHKRH